MELVNEKFELVDIYDLSFKTVPRGLFVNDRIKLALDYHADLLSLSKGDSVQIGIYHKKPELPKSTYLMRGVVYKIEESKFECSFGGLLLLYQGNLGSSLVEDGELYLSVLKI
ncbi:hypothetical protein PAEPH01_1218 [Pancytospora epiphaga]|nr:hypothetical protein PAEPH01_1218 [Pancytospora epiphaga]